MCVHACVCVHAYVQACVCVYACISVHMPDVQELRGDNEPPPPKLLGIFHGQEEVEMPHHYSQQNGWPPEREKKKGCMESVVIDALHFTRRAP